MSRHWFFLRGSTDRRRGQILAFLPADVSIALPYDHLREALTLFHRALAARDALSSRLILILAGQLYVIRRCSVRGPDPGGMAAAYTIR